MPMTHSLELPYWQNMARKLVAERGAEYARRVIDMHRRKPLAGAESYPDMIAAEIDRQAEEQAA